MEARIKGREKNPFNCVINRITPSNSFNDSYSYIWDSSC